MDPSEYAVPFFLRGGFHRRTCTGCGHAFWTLGEFERCQEDPCTPYGFIGHPPTSRAFAVAEMRETFLHFFEQRGHTRIRRYPTVARWRNDVFFTQASIYDFQPWVTSGAVPPPANPLAISQPVLRFVDLAEVGRSGRHLTVFEMMAHHAFNRPDHEVYFKERCVELCHEFLTEPLGIDPRGITYKEEEWEGGGNLGPSLSVGVRGVELATLVFMEYVRENDALKPMPLTVVDTGYGLERLTWISQGTKTAYEAVFGAPYDTLRRTFSAPDASILVDHARALNFLLTDGVVPSNSKEGYFARLLVRRMLRLVAKAPESPSIIAILDDAAHPLTQEFPELAHHREDLHRVVEAEVTRYEETLRRGRDVVRRQEGRLRAEGRTVGVPELIEWYDSLGLPPDVATAELEHPPGIPTDFYAQVAARHEKDVRETDYTEHPGAGPPIPSSVPETRVEYFLDPYTDNFEAHVVWTEGPFAVLDRTYFYPTGGGQITDTGHLGDVPVVDVARRGPWVVHRLDRPSPFTVGERVRGRIDSTRRLQLMQHHTGTHLLNGALREALGPHVWQAGAYKGLDGARIDITHFKALTPEELRSISRRVNTLIREDRPVRSYFESRTEAERRFGFTLYQGGAVPGKSLRIVEVEGFDVEACGGTHCTRTGEVGLVTILGTERIQDGVVRVHFAAGDRALDVVEEREATLDTLAKRLGVPPVGVPQAVGRLEEELEVARRSLKSNERADLSSVAARLIGDAEATERIGATTIIAANLTLDRPQLMELSRLLTRDSERVAILAGTSADRGILFVGSTSAGVPANALVAEALALFGGKGGGNPSAATAVGEPGAPLEEAWQRVRALARDRAVGGQDSR